MTISLSTLPDGLASKAAGDAGPVKALVRSVITAYGVSGVQLIVTAGGAVPAERPVEAAQVFVMVSDTTKRAGGSRDEATAGTAVGAAAASASAQATTCAQRVPRANPGAPGAACVTGSCADIAYLGMTASS
ncbi:MAG: hypothetical protein OSA97_15875 [Nevskia sp.]|nr:hypothetical protein [Nevskia sp.]